MSARIQTSKAGVRRAVPAAGMLAAVILASCSPHLRLARLDLVEMGSQEVVRRAVEQAGTRGDLFLSGPIQVRANGGSLGGQASVLFASPDSLRLEIQGFLGANLGLAVMLGDYLQVYLPTERAVMEGSVTPLALARMTGEPIEREGLLELFFGPALTRDWESWAKSIDRFDVSNDRVVIGLPHLDGGRAVYTLNTLLEFTEASYSDAEGRLVWRSQFGSYRRVGDAQLPSEVVLELPSRNLAVEFQASRRNSTPAHTPQDFHITVPSGVRRLLLGPIVPPDPPAG